jgi:RNA polymerase sigma factor (sigma-70 family)
MAQVLDRKKEVVDPPSTAITHGVREIIALVDDPRTSVAKLTSVIRHNKVLMERILRQANSAVYGLPRRISDPNFAVVLLGFDALKEMIVRSVVAGAFRRMVNSVVGFEEFWNHSIGCGLGARMIAEETGTCDPNEAFVAGLLHDIGYLLINWSGEDQSQTQSFPGLALKVSDKASQPVQDYHAEVGAWLAERWSISSHVVEAIRSHHTPSGAAPGTEIVAVVHVSEVLCHQLQIGHPHYESVGGFDPAALRILGLKEASLMQQTPDGYASMFIEHMTRVPKFESLVRDLKVNLLEAMEDLSEQERLTLALLYYEGLSLSDVSKVLGLAAEQVEQLQATALARLQAAVTLMA